MHSVISIREASEADLEEILLIYNDVILHTTAVYDYEAHSIEQRKRWFEERRAAGFPVFVAELANRIAGFASFGPFRAWPAYQFSAEHSLYVSEAFRNQGIGRLLLSEIIRRATEKGLHTLVAGIDKENKASIALHEHFGFEVAGELKQVGWKFDRWLDLVFMQRML